MSNASQPQDNGNIIPWSSELLPVISRTGDYQEHNTPDRQFCWDIKCPCKDNKEAIDQLHEQYLQGLVSERERDLIYQGRTV